MNAFFSEEKAFVLFYFSVDEFGNHRETRGMSVFSVVEKVPFSVGQCIEFAAKAMIIRKRMK